MVPETPTRAATINTPAIAQLWDLTPLAILRAIRTAPGCSRCFQSSLVCCHGGPSRQAIRYRVRCTERRSPFAISSWSWAPWDQSRRSMTWWPASSRHLLGLLLSRSTPDGKRTNRCRSVTSSEAVSLAPRSGFVSHGQPSRRPAGGRRRCPQAPARGPAVRELCLSCFVDLYAFSRLRGSGHPAAVANRTNVCERQYRGYDAGSKTRARPRHGSWWPPRPSVLRGRAGFDGLAFLTSSTAPSRPSASQSDAQKHRMPHVLWYAGWRSRDRNTRRLGQPVERGGSSCRSVPSAEESRRCPRSGVSRLCLRAAKPRRQRVGFWVIVSRVFLAVATCQWEYCVMSYEASARASMCPDPRAIFFSLAASLAHSPDAVPSYSLCEPSTVGHGSVVCEKDVSVESLRPTRSARDSTL